MQYRKSGARIDPIHIGNKMASIQGDRRSGETAKFVNSAGMEFVWIPPGAFRMGSPKWAPVRCKGEVAREVTLTRGFHMATAPVTKGQWERFIAETKYQGRGRNTEEGDEMGRTFRFTQEGDHPVVCVSWYEANAFARWLSRLEGLHYGLPTEAEWEYACRAGSDTVYPYGDDPAELGRYAWYGRNGGRCTHPVEQLQPNAWGLYDMLGNVWEWCRDWASEYTADGATDPAGPVDGTTRIIRGCSWLVNEDWCRPAHRMSLKPDTRICLIGFRLVLRKEEIDSRTPR